MCAVEHLTGTCVVPFVSVVKKLVRLSTSENEEKSEFTGRLVGVVKLFWLRNQEARGSYSLTYTYSRD